MATFGVKVPKNDQADEEANMPELIRYSKEFAYPTNTVDPATGTPSSAAVWSVSARADKTRFFKEPGFLFGVVCVRPKVHLSVIEGSLTSYMDSGFNWVPQIMGDMPFTTLEQFATATGPAPGAYGEDYWIDMRDLFLYGEQFRNHDLSTQGNSVALPTVLGDERYPTEAMADALFIGTGKHFRMDGMLSLNISGKVGRDTTG